MEMTPELKSALAQLDDDEHIRHNLVVRGLQRVPSTFFEHHPTFSYSKDGDSHYTGGFEGDISLSDETLYGVVAKLFERQAIGFTKPAAIAIATDSPYLDRVFERLTCGLYQEMLWRSWYEGAGVTLTLDNLFWEARVMLRGAPLTVRGETPDEAIKAMYLALHGPRWACGRPARVGDRVRGATENSQAIEGIAVDIRDGRAFIAFISAIELNKAVLPGLRKRGRDPYLAEKEGSFLPLPDKTYEPLAWLNPDQFVAVAGMGSIHAGSDGSPDFYVSPGYTWAYLSALDWMPPVHPHFA